jgi:Leucine-rich repeat (LRR) protein
MSHHPIEPFLLLLDSVHINLSHNNISQLPETLGLLASLVKLDMSNNSLVDLPESIAGCSSLQVRWSEGRFRAAFSLEMECLTRTHISYRLSISEEISLQMYHHLCFSSMA